MVNHKSNYYNECWATPHHEAEKTCQDSGHRPCRVPGVWMEVTYGETETSVDLKTSVRGHHDYAWRLKRVLLGEQKFAVIVTT